MKEKEFENLLLVEGVNAQGYGTIPKLVMKDNILLVIPLVNQFHWLPLYISQKRPRKYIKDKLIINTRKKYR